LLVHIDDATSRFIELAFAEVESVFDYFRATRRDLERYGRPMAFYTWLSTSFLGGSHGIDGRPRRAPAAGAQALSQAARTGHGIVFARESGYLGREGGRQCRANTYVPHDRARRHGPARHEASPVEAARGPAGRL
jgi:hypothetical protein